MTEDRLDPEVRARAIVRRARTRAILRAVGILAAWWFAAASGIAYAADGLGEGGTIGASIAAIALLIAVWGTWPAAWSARERQHRELEAMWQQVRPDALDAAPWDRFAGWARADDQSVVLLELRRAGTTNDLASPYALAERRRVDPSDPEAAAEEMERFRRELLAREERAWSSYERASFREEQQAHEAALREIDDAAAAEIAAREAAMREEMAAHEAAERRRDAAALARALRKP